MRQLAAAFALAGIAILIAACSSPNQKPPTPTSASPAGPPRIAVADLEGLLLSPGDINIAMGTTGMIVAAALNQMWDDGAEMADNDCRFADGPAEASVYAGSGWTAVRGGIVQQPGDFTDFVGLAVVSFPSADDATAFFTASAERWPACSDRQYTFRRPGKSDVLWTVGPVTNTNGTLIAAKTQEGTQNWSCERALSVRSNVAIDVNACSNNPSGSADNIVQQIAAKVPSR
jgi:serine/threonine-protein kinase